jgi:hypothetical protein
MKQIETQFTQKGWQLTQRHRVYDIAIFERVKETVEPHYEVVRIKSHNGFQIPGTDRMSEPAEYYPSEKSWGVDGFTFSSMEEASAKMHKLLLGKDK